MQKKSQTLLAIFAAIAVAIAFKKRAPIAEGALMAADALGLKDARGYRNNNPGNIRYIVRNPWDGQVGNDNGYGIYTSPQAGWRALGKQLLKYEASGLRTVRAIISTWAPATENLTASYIDDVADRLGVDANAPLNVNVILPQLAEAIAIHENGFGKYTAMQITEWVRAP